MTLKESKIKTTPVSELGMDVRIKVYYTDSLNPIDAFDLIHSSVGFLPYIFAGYFYNEEKSLWFFSNARRHEEMRSAVMEEIGSSFNYIYG